LLAVNRGRSLLVLARARCAVKLIKLSLPMRRRTHRLENFGNSSGPQIYGLDSSLQSPSRIGALAGIGAAKGRCARGLTLQVAIEVAIEIGFVLELRQVNRLALALARPRIEVDGA